jgi:Holliday junction DNA helicase RuvA
MYEYIIGTIKQVNPYYITLENSGIGYFILTANPYSFSAFVEQEKKVYIHQVIREDGHQLIGFHELDEKLLFLKLISVSGIGPKSALAILAVDDMNGLITAIRGKNVTYLTKFPGVGKKTASQMVLDLEGKLDEFDAVANSDAFVEVIDNENIALDEALEALKALGYSEKDVKRVAKLLVQEEQMKTDEYLRLAFKLITK